MRTGLFCVLTFASCSVFAARPLLTVGRIGTAPVLDGRLDEDAWQQAIVVSDLLRVDTGKLESQPTEIAVVHDAEALYIGARCHELVLDPKQQRLHEFRAAQGPETRDDRVWHDDSIELFISPASSGAPYYQFIVNSRGARFEGCGKDKSWDGTWDAAGSTSNDGYFDIEVRIPFSTLGAVPESGRAWRAQFCRNRMPKDDYHCAWPPAPGGFHRPEAFAELQFTSRTLPKVRLDGFVDHASVGTARVETQALAGVLLHIDATSSAGRAAARIERTLDADGCVLGPLRAALADAIATPGSYRVQATLSVPSHAHPLLVTPAVRWMLGTHPARLVVSVRGDLEWHGAVNGRVLEDRQDTVKLRPGTNAIVLHCRRGAEGALRAALSAGGRELDSAGWRRHDGPLEAWVDAELDDRDWLPVEPLDDGWLWQGGSDEVVLRRTVTIPTESYCSPDNGPTELARGAAQMLTFAFNDLTAVSDFRFELTLPSFITLIDPLDREFRPGFSAIGHERVRLDDGWTRHVLDLSSRGRAVDGFGGELQWCESADGSVGMFYERVMRFGGSSEWTRVEARAFAPAKAKAVRAWFLKWPRRGVSGLLEFDDVSLRKADDDREMIEHGDMEEAFKATWLIGSAKRCREPDGNHFLRMDAKPDAWQRQIWFRKQDVIPVEGGVEYVFSCRARWRDVVQPVAGKGTYPVVVQVAGDAPEGALDVSYGWSADKGATATLARELTCTVGPPIRGRQPERILLVNWPSWGYAEPLGRLASEAQLQAIAEQWFRCGINVARPIPRQNRFSLGLASRFTMMSTVHWHNAGREHRGAVLDYLKEHEPARAVDYSGKRHESRACPSYLLGDGGAALRELAVDGVRSEARGVAADIYCTDYEVPVSSPPTICFDDRCISGFRQFAGLGQDVELTPETLIRDHIYRWTEFHVLKNVELLRLVADAIKDARPDAKYMVYSGYHNDYTKKHYGVDWALLRSVLDIGSAGYGRPVESVEATVLALGDKPLVGGVIEYSRSTHPHSLSTRVMRRVLDCRGGVMSWYGTVVDARWYRAFADASRVAAEFEELIRGGRRNDSLVQVAGDLSPADVCVYDGDARRLIVIFNESGTVRRGTLTVSGLAGTSEVKGFPSGAAAVSHPIELNIPAWSYRVFSVVK